MKRSYVNKIIEEAKKILHQNKIVLPPFGYWTPEDWKHKSGECNEIRDCMLGWDITDFGFNQFDKIGLVLFTLRNGHMDIKQYKDKTYCEKLLILKEGQMCPMHFHWYKVEDIINRAGGNLIIELYNSTDDKKLGNTDVVVSMDGVNKKFSAGAQVILKTGESITLPERLYHKFWAENGKGPLIVGEVSKVNDDKKDNCFLEEVGRFPVIEEDCPGVHYMCTEYPM